MSNNRSSRFRSIIIGGIAGISAHIVTSPLDVVKIIAQVGSKQYNGFLGTIKNVYLEGGLAGFWKGYWASYLRMFPYSDIYTTIHETVENMTADPKTGEPTALGSIVALAIANAIATVCVYPLDTIQTRLILQASGQPKYKGISDAFRVIFKEEGFLAFYRGLIPTAIGEVLKGGLITIPLVIMSILFGDPCSKLMDAIYFCLSSLFVEALFYPFDTISKRMQALTSDVDVEFTGLWDCIWKTVKKNGILGLWRGALANLARVVLVHSVGFFRQVCIDYLC